MRWARKQGISCFRVYDADLPDYALGVDLYLGVGSDAGRRVAVVEERRRPASVDAHRAARRFSDACALAAAVLDVPADALVAKPWRADVAGTKQTLVVQENGLEFAPCLGDAFESGLPLGMRGVRELVRQHARGKRFANVFDASSAATVYAAAGGATSTVTVNAFAHDAARVRAALVANGLAGKAHRFVRVDPLAWTEHEASKGHRDDLVLCAPSAKLLAEKGAEVVDAALALVDAGGTMVLVCGGDAVDLRRLRGIDVQDVSAATLPLDFARSAKDHRCCLLKRA
jgi:23S rRNA (guanine2445-N2)-methyltransferase / 23S rRNA (guanine2069-N7)-methyltransferase